MKAGTTIALNAFVVSAVLSAGWMTAQAANTRTIDQYTCKDVMREHGDNRDVTIAFLHGFLLGKSGGSNFRHRCPAQADQRFHRVLSG